MRREEAIEAAARALLAAWQDPSEVERAERAFMDAAYERETIFVALTDGDTSVDRAALGAAKARTYDAWLALRAARERAGAK